MIHEVADDDDGDLVNQGVNEVSPYSDAPSAIKIVEYNFEN